MEPLKTTDQLTIEFWEYARSEYDKLTYYTDRKIFLTFYKEGLFLLRKKMYSAHYKTDVSIRNEFELFNNFTNWVDTELLLLEKDKITKTIPLKKESDFINNRIIWNKSEKSLIEMFEKLSKSKNGFIAEESLKNISQHFSLPNNPTYNYKSEEATKIKWKKAQTHLMWFIKNLIDKEIISVEKGKLHMLTALHFCGLNNKVFVPKDLNSALSNTDHITEKKIKTMRGQEEYEKLYNIITDISD